MIKFTEKKSLFRTRQLKEGHTVPRLVLSKARAGLGIKADYLLGTKIGYGSVELSPHAVYYLYLAWERSIFQFLQFLRRYSFNVHNQL